MQVDLFYLNEAGHTHRELVPNLVTCLLCDPEGTKHFTDFFLTKVTQLMRFLPLYFFFSFCWSLIPLAKQEEDLPVCAQWFSGQEVN